MASSMLAFSKSKGLRLFGRPPRKTDREFVRESLRPLVVDFHRAWKRRAARSHLVRYEDLVLEPAQTLAALLAYLELDSSPETVNALVTHASRTTDKLATHRTSAEAKASIGRWQRESDESVRALYQTVFDDLLADFGYSNAPSRAGT